MPRRSPKSSKGGPSRSRPTVSGEHTRIYPVRSLLPDVQPDDRVAAPSVDSQDAFQFLNKTLESAAASSSSQRTARWTESIPMPPTADTAHVFPKYEDTPPLQSSPSEDLINSVFSPFSTSHLRKISRGEASQPDPLVSSDGTPRVDHSLGHSSPQPSMNEGNSNEIKLSIQQTHKASSNSVNSNASVASAASLSSDAVLGLGAGHYVHLPPLRSSTLASRTSRRSTMNTGTPGDASYSGPDAEQLGHADTSSGSEELVKGSRQPEHSMLSSTESSIYVTHRFKHVETEHGHHLLIGREGKLERCEDEPIRTPGAVQGFGVLIALEEDYETGNLIVRQMSENSTEILGLTPQFLFSLECFSYTLSEDQADILRDNIQYLSEPDKDSPSDSTPEESPQVFLLSGWGEPGSVVQEESSNNDSSIEMGTAMAESTAERRPWTCWVAAHRTKRATPPPTSSDAQDHKNDPNVDSNDDLSSSSQHAPKDLPPLIILEFELENDLYNPIYPIPDSNPASRPESPAQRSEGSSGISSPEKSIGSDETRMQRNVVPPQADSVKSTTPSTSETRPPDRDTMPAPGISRATTPAGRASVPGGHTLAKNPGLAGDEDWDPTADSVSQSTTSQAKPIRALQRMRRMERSVSYRQEQRPFIQKADDHALSASPHGQLKDPEETQSGPRRHHGEGPNVGTLDVFAVLAQVNEQLSNAPDLSTFLDVVVGVIKDLTQFHRVLVYQFDESLNGQVVTELVDWDQTHDLYKGLHFPAADIPIQARELYNINKVRCLYNRGQVTARLVGRTKADIEAPLDLTHSYLRAMSPIHIKYLENMGVRGSMSISIVAFGELWGLICCHSYGEQGMRVSFPVGQMLRLLSDSISRNVERLSYAQRLRTRKLISTLPTEAHPTGYIVSNGDDLLDLFDADFGILVIGDGAKILGPNNHGQDILIAAEYLRLKRYKLMQVSQEVTRDFSDMNLPTGLNVIAGLLYVPLSPGGNDFIAFLRKGQLRNVTWAGRPLKGASGQPVLEPRTSFKAWSETVYGRCRAWTNDQLETAGILALVYGKFINIWREKESALRATQLANDLISNANLEVRTPLNHIIHYLELALDGHLDDETRENLNISYAASKSLLFTINDLLDLARLESGGETSSSDPFDLHATIEEAVQTYRSEALRRQITFDVITHKIPRMVIGDARKIRIVIANLTANAVKFTEAGSIAIECQTFEEPAGLRDDEQIVIEITVSDTGCGIDSERLESMFRDFEQIEQVSLGSKPSGLGLGLAVCARTIEQLGGQLRVDSKPGQGSHFSILIPFMLPGSGDATSWIESSVSPANASSQELTPSSGKGEINNLVETISSTPGGSSFTGSVEQAVDKRTDINSEKVRERVTRRAHELGHSGEFEVEDSMHPIQSVKVDPFDLDSLPPSSHQAQGSFERQVPGSLLIDKVSPAANPSSSKTLPKNKSAASKRAPQPPPPSPLKDQGSLRVLIVEDDFVNRTILSKRLTLDGHKVVTTTNGQEAVDMIESDRAFDCVLMDIQMPVKNGFEASKAIRAFEKANALALADIRPSTDLNGRIPIFAVSASLREEERGFMVDHGIDGWMLKPIDFKRLRVLISGVTDARRRKEDIYAVGCNWERGGWMTPAVVSELPPLT